ncbi:MAG: hypothetical protein IM638_08905 [Bacteroidetes bacterium]|nr:hypothetical protein [Bacteroidota bacterium]
MLTPIKTNLLEDFIGKPIDQTDYWPLTVLIEKATGELSNYVIPGKTEIVLIKCERGLQIGLANVEVKDLNFALEDSSIKRIIVQKLMYRQANFRPSVLLILGMIIFCFIADARFNHSRMGYFPIITGSLMGMLASLFLSTGNKFSITLELETSMGIETLIVSFARKKHILEFFGRYYSYILSK